MSKKWKLNGSYMESCNCDTACPCVFLSDPTEGDCTVLVGWHIDKGNFGDVKLDGLNVALMAYAPGNMAQVKWEAALYFDDRATQAQQEALTAIYAGQAGGHVAMLVSHVGEVKGIASLPITFQAEGKQRKLVVGSVGSAEIEAITGQGGNEVTVEGHPLCIAPGYPAVAARSSQLTYQDYGLNWEISGKNGFYSPFTYQGA